MNRINISPILFRYMFQHLAMRVLMAALIIIAIVGVIDIAELYRRVAEKQGSGVLTVLSLEVVKIPSMIPELIPFGVLVGSIISFQKMRLSNEIVIARTSGLSQIRLVIPASVFALVLALFMLVVIDPIASATAKRYETMESEIFVSNARNLTVSTEGIWMRDQGSNVSLIIHGDSIGLNEASIINPEVYSFDRNDQVIARYFPEKMVLKRGYWDLRGGNYMDQAGNVIPMKGRHIKTDLRQRDLSHSNKPPATIPVFELWNYIKVLESTGLPTLGHASYLYTQLGLPFVLIGMVMIVARLTLGFSNRGGWIHLVVLSLTGGLIFYFVKDFLHVMGTSGRLHPIVAGFSPGVIMVCLGVILLMRADEN